MANPWFRLYSEFMHDPKVQKMEEKHQRRLVMILCMRCNGSVTLQDEDVTFVLRISDEEWKESKRIFIAQNFISEDGFVLNWDKRQYSSDSSRERVARHREKQKRVTVTDSNVTVTVQNRTDTEQNRTDTEKITRKRDVFQLPPEIPEQIAKDFLALRKAKKSPLTETAYRGIEKEARKAGYTALQAIEICCQRGWAGFKAEWVSKAPTGHKAEKFSTINQIFPERSEHGTNGQIIDITETGTTEGNGTSLPENVLLLR